MAPSKPSIFGPLPVRRALTAAVALTAGMALAVAAPVAQAAPPKAPTLTKVTPSSGSTLGGTVVTLSGSRFATGAQVSFGSTAGVSVQVRSSSVITVKTPRHVAGKVVVRVKVGSRSTTVTAATAFTYYAPPAVTKVSPASGATTGGTSVTVAGRDFRAVRSVLFGATPATRVTVKSATGLVAVAPKHAIGPVTVKVVTAYGTSAATTTSRFVYRPTPPSTSIAHAVPHLDAFDATDLDCAGSYCLAVDDDRGLFSESTDGVWSTPARLPGTLSSPVVRCLSVDVCMVMGQDDAGKVASVVRSSRTWSPARRLPALSDDDWDYVTLEHDQLACTSSTCVIVAPSFGTPIAAKFTGSSWVELPAPPFRPDLIACPSNGSCIVTGQDRDYVSRWTSLNDTTWSSGGKLPADLVSDLSCPTSDYCLAGGDTVDGAVTLTFDGSTWTAADGSAPGDLTCPTRDWCAGTRTMEDDTAELVVLDHGAASSTPVPQFGEYPGPQQLACGAVGSCELIVSNGALVRYDRGQLASRPVFPTQQAKVGCASTTFCMSTDEYGDLQRFDGSEWTSAGTGGLNYAASIACPTITRCVLVGESPTGPAYSVWDGASWTTAAPPAAVLGLSDVSCVGPTFCEAVGTATSGSGTAAVGLRISGSTADTATTVLPRTTHAEQISCASPTLCLAVAELPEVNGESQGWLPTIFDGQRWAARPGASTEYAPAVACAPGTTWCTGLTDDAQFVWSAGRWSAGAAGVPDLALGSVACPKAGMCLATGRRMRLDGYVAAAAQLVSGQWSAPVVYPSTLPFVAASCVSMTWCATVSQFVGSS